MPSSPYCKPTQLIKEYLTGGTEQGNSLNCLCELHAKEIRTFQTVVTVPIDPFKDLKLILKNNFNTTPEDIIHITAIRCCSCWKTERDSYALSPYTQPYVDCMPSKSGQHDRSTVTLA